MLLITYYLFWHIRPPEFMLQHMSEYLHTLMEYTF